MKKMIAMLLLSLAMSAHAGFRVEEEKPAAAKAAEAAASKPTEPAAVWKINRGDRISDAFRRWGKTVGWDVAWESRELASEIEFTGKGNFDEAVVDVLEALNANGAKLDHMFHDGNRMLRVMERK